MKQKILLVFAISIFVGLAGAGVSTILPNQYTAKGLLIVTRKADEPSKEVFTYEGYYAQQNAGAYTATFLSILQSPNNLKSADSGADLKELSRLVKAKRDGTQAIVLSVKGKTSQDAINLWEKVADSAIQTHNKLKASADPLLEVSKTPNSPVVLKTYPEWTNIFGASFAFSIIIVSSILIISRYIYDSLALSKGGS
ncbi:MAG: Wzz/FepE/Etk N-terminal domain-containing protein [Patescibacteria group bacterium]